MASSAAQRAHGSALPGLHAVTGWLSAGLKLKVAPPSALSHLSENALAWIPDSSCLATAIDSDDGTPCVLGDASASSTVVLFGDSSADEWALDLGSLGAEDHFRVVAYLHAACPVGEVTVEIAGHTPDPTCATFRTTVLSDLAGMRPAPVLVVVSQLRLSNYVTSTGQTLSDAKWSSALAATLDALEADGLAVASLHGVPVATQDPGVCLTANPKRVSACTTPLKKADPGGYDAATKKGATVADAGDVDLQPLLCTTKGCPAVSDGQVTHSGDNHVTEAYSAKVVLGFGELLGCLVARSFTHRQAAAAVLDSLLGGKPSAATLAACRALPG